MWKKLFRIRKMQTTILAFIIALCSILLTSAFAILFSMNASFYHLAEETKAPDAMIVLYNDTKEGETYLTEKLAKMDGVEEVISHKQHYIQEEMFVGEKNIDAYMQMRPYEERIHGKLRYQDGNAEIAKNLKDDECMIPVCVFHENHLKIGDKLTIRQKSGNLEYKIVGTFAGIYDASVAFDSTLMVKRIPEDLYQKNVLWIKTSEDYDADNLEYDYYESYDEKLPAQVYSQNSAISSATLVNKLLGAILCALGGTMLIVSCIIIVFVIRNVLMVDAKNIAIYKTMGYATRDIMRMYVLFYFILAQSATIVGEIIAKFYSDYLLNEMYRSIVESANVNILSCGWISYVLIVGLVCLNVVIVVTRAKHVKPVYALNGMQATNTTKKRASYTSGSGFSPWNMAIRMITRNKRGMVGILVAAAVSVMGMNFAVISYDVAKNLKQDNDYWMGIDRSQIMIALSDAEDMEELTKQLEEDSAVTKVVRANLEGSAIMIDKQNNRGESVVTPIVYEDYDKADISCTRGRNPRKGDEVAITGKIAEETGKEIGDYLTMKIDGQEKTFLITGLFQTYYNIGYTIRLTREAYEGTPHECSYNMASVYLKENLKPEDVLNEMKVTYGKYGKVYLRTDQYQAIMNMIMEPQESAIPPMTVIVLFIGAANIFCIILLKNTKEEKMNGIYKSIGYSNGHLLLANIHYVAILGAATMLVAIPLTLWMYPDVMKLALGIFGLVEYNVQYQVAHLILANCIIFLLFIISTLLSSQSIRRVSVRQLIVE